MFGLCHAGLPQALPEVQTGGWTPLSSRALRSILQDLLHRLGHDATQYHTHSLRIGAATCTAAAQAGLPLSTIQRLGRWRSSAFTTYTRHPLTLPTDTASLALASTCSTHFTLLYAICTYHLEPSFNQSIWGLHLGGTLWASTLTNHLTVSR